MFFRGSRRAGSAPPDRAGPEPGADRRGETGHALRAPSRLHAFNRYEIKYLVDAAAVPVLRDEIAARMSADSNGDRGAYGVWSLYYDTSRLRFYWEKIEGLKFRRKLRVRHYGDRSGVGEGTPVFVEIKQRVNRVTQKRRVALPYRLARELCDQRTMVEHDPRDRALVEEILDLLIRLDLRPSAMTGYQREAFVGSDADIGLRVTMDHRVRGRDRDFDLGAESENRFIIPPDRSVLEVKANERVPYWLTDLTARHNLQVQRVSKYCQAIEAYGRAPRSVFHVPDPAHEAAAAAMPGKGTRP
ncbi:polyphosphate polymerase domain-containing protein [Actinorugispora endophytica]|uniref:VTC domain-containing protein n=1 Tax=Actinorugispora endophytica TaxID=1605990 RepID=A0A4R6UZI8_9ACTN|nr:polyphosphate polymerase domain-containing protein [Actinorugispora endophytica]TDQ52894.1 VTC domain-containing protein [Actinorugispora endophytica]